MAKMVQAVQKFGPKVVYGPTAKIDELAGWMARSSGLNPHAARMALGELSDAILFYLRRGSPVTLPGLGRFRVTVGRFGELRMHTSCPSAPSCATCGTPAATWASGRTWIGPCGPMLTTRPPGIPSSPTIPWSSPRPTSPASRPSPGRTTWPRPPSGAGLQPYPIIPAGVAVTLLQADAIIPVARLRAQPSSTTE